MISKLADKRREDTKMHLKIRELQPQIIRTDTHIKKEKQSKHDTKDSQQNYKRKQIKEKGKQKERQTQSNNLKQLTKWQ